MKNNKKEDVNQVAKRVVDQATGNKPRERVFKPLSSDSWAPITNKAAVVLALLVNETKDPKIAKSVNSKMSFYNAAFKHVSTISCPPVRHSIALMILRDAQKEIVNSLYPQKITEHFLCAIRTIYRVKVLGRNPERK